MKILFKLTLYIVACGFVFFVIAQEYNKTHKDEEITIQRTAHALEWTKTIQIYVPKRSDTTDCSLVYPLPRTIINAETLGPGSLEALLEGVTADEVKSGYMTSIPKKVLIQKFEIKNKVAYVDLSKELTKGVAGSCRTQAIRSEIETTLKHVPGIEFVSISVDGQVESW